MTDKAAYQEAVFDLVRQAMAEDQKRNYPQAYQLYKSAIGLVIKALKCTFHIAETNPRLKSVLENKAKEWLSRAESLSRLLGLPQATEARRKNPESPMPEPQIYYSNTLLEQANSLYLVAVKADQEQRYEEACRLYLVVAQRLESALQCKPYVDEMDTAVRQSWVRNREWMLERTQQIRIWLSHTSQYP